MMSHHILEKAIELKVFQLWELTEELRRDWDCLYTTAQIKGRVKDWVKNNLESGFLETVSREPLIFAIKDCRENWREHIRYMTCPICGKEFIPTQKVQDFCSQECRKEHYRRYHRKRRKKLGMRLDSKRRWTPAEVERAIALKEQGMSYREIADALGRSPNGVKDKLKRLGVVRK